MSGRRVLLVGATGLVGRELLALLVADAAVSEVVVLVRRALGGGGRHSKVREVVVDFEALEELARGEPSLFAVDQFYCALGTTIKRAGSQAAFRRVDHDYPLQLARLARAAGARHCLLVSALGADAGSRVFYNRVKGELEQGIRALAFPSFTIARPSLLEGDREEVRPGERIAARFGWLVPGRWKPVHVRQVARALVTAAGQDVPGVRIMENVELRGFAR